LIVMQAIAHQRPRFDDAAGKAFDKVARLLGFRPAGSSTPPRVATPAFDFPRALTNAASQSEHRFNFSFSGLKTAVLRQIRGLDADRLPIADLAASFQQAVVDVLVSKTADAARECGVRRVCVCGGVAANRALRSAMAQHLPVPVSIPPLFLCTDNAAMMGAAAHYQLLAEGATPLDFDVEPDLGLVSS
jgi:N6-L-threonylcarbamoyladenine synthase